MQWDDHGRLMVPIGAVDAYQLLRAPCGGSGSENLSQRPSWGLGATAIGQLYSDGLHKQSGRDCDAICNLTREELYEEGEFKHINGLTQLRQLGSLIQRSKVQKREGYFRVFSAIYLWIRTAVNYVKHH